MGWGALRPPPAPRVRKRAPGPREPEARSQVENERRGKHSPLPGDGRACGVDPPSPVQGGGRVRLLPRGSFATKAWLKG